MKTSTDFFQIFCAISVHKKAAKKHPAQGFGKICLMTTRSNVHGDEDDDSSEEEEDAEDVSYESDEDVDIDDKEDICEELFEDVKDECKGTCDVKENGYNRLKCDRCCRDLCLIHPEACHLCCSGNTPTIRRIPTNVVYLRLPPINSALSSFK